MKLLLHACCAPCASASIERLLSEGYDVEVYFYMPNIFPFEEYERRLQAMKILVKFYNVPLIEGDYNHAYWLLQIEGKEQQPEGGTRCFACYNTLLKQTYLKAQSLGIAHFCTSLTISPHKNAKKIQELGFAFEGYKHFDFKKQDGYKRSIELSKMLGLYRQCYCACEFSMQKQTIQSEN